MLRSGLLIFINITILYLLLFYFNGVNYFVTSLLDLANDVVENGYIPTTSDRILTFWDSHKNQFIHYPGVYIIYTVLNLITGIDTCIFRYIPIIFLFLFIVIYLLISIFISSLGLRAIVAFIFAFHWVTTFPHTWIISYHALGYFSHFLIIYLVTKLMLKSDKNINYTKLTIIISLIYTVALFNYYATSSFSVVFIFFLLISYILLYRNIRSIVFDNYLSIFVTFLILFLLFDFISNIIISKPNFFEQSLFYIINSVFNFITSGITSTKLFLLGSPKSKTFIDNIIAIFRLLMAFLPILLVLVIMFLGNVPQHLRASLLTLLIASVGTGVFESFPYASVLGSVNLRYLQLYANVLSILIIFKLIKLKQLGRYIRNILLFLCTFSMVIITSIGIASYAEKINNEWSIKPKLSNLIEYQRIYDILDNNTRIKANFQVSGELRFAEVCSCVSNKKIINSPLLEDTYFIYLNVQNETYFNIKEKYKRWFLVFSLLDFEKPVWGDVWGYATPPFGSSFLHVIKLYFNIYYSSEKFLIVN